jgi:RimJ/RimL family protein N-acetyltransferase
MLKSPLSTWTISWHLGEMRQNYEKCILGDRCVLVPYRKEHVDRYHKWMLDPDLLESTCSESLSIEEEYEMQESWRDDATKCTFIILDRDRVDGLPDHGKESYILRNLPAMVGDVNLFLSDMEQTEDSTPETDDLSIPLGRQAELDIMIAEKQARGKGIGSEACRMMMWYGAVELGLKRFFCKINEDNVASLSLFMKLGFLQCAYAKCFKQVEVEIRSCPTEEMALVLRRVSGGSELSTFNLNDQQNNHGMPSF